MKTMVSAHLAEARIHGTEECDKPSGLSTITGPLVRSLSLEPGLLWRLNTGGPRGIVFWLIADS